MKCKDCKFCTYEGAGIDGGYKCRHPDIEESAKKYEQLKRKVINKEYPHIGYDMIKTSLRYCPYKINREEAS